MIKRRAPLKRTPIKKRRSKARRGRVVDDTYLAWIRIFPCVICWGYPGVYTPLGTCQVYWEYEYENGCPSQRSKTEAAHTGPHGLGQKSNDDTAIPLCGLEHHREGPHSIHVLGKRFWEFHGLDRDVLLAKLRQRYKELGLRPSG